MIRQSCDFEKDFDFVLLQLADTLNTQLTFITEAFEVLTKKFKFDSLLRKTY